MKEEKNSENKLLVIINILTTIIIIYMGIFIKNEIELIYLPISHLIVLIAFNIITPREKIQEYKFAITLIYIITFIRYVITPLIASIYDKYIYFGPVPTVNQFNLAIKLMIFELAATYAVSTIMVRLSTFNVKNNNKIEFCTNKVTLVSVIIISILVIILTNNYNLLKINSFFIIDNLYEAPEIQRVLTGLILILLYITKIFSYFVLLSIVSEKHNKSNKKIYIFLAYLISFVYLASMMGTSRWTMVFSTVIIIYALVKLYPTISKALIVPIIFVAIISIMSISIYKLSGKLKNSTNVINGTFQELSQQFDYYFSGVGLVAQSIDMADVYENEITIHTFFNDFLGSIPYVSKFIDQTDRTNVYFNTYNYFRKDQTSLIIPMIGNCYCYFPYFPVLYTCICVSLAFLCNYKMNNTNKLEFKIMHLYMLMYLVLCFAFNAQIIFGYFITKYLYIIILLKINTRIKWKNSNIGKENEINEKSYSSNNSEGM